MSQQPPPEQPNPGQQPSPSQPFPPQGYAPPPFPQAPQSTPTATNRFAFLLRPVTLPLWSLILIACVGCGLLSNVVSRGSDTTTNSSNTTQASSGGNSTDKAPKATNTPKPTATPTHTPTWTTIQNFKGSGDKKTEVFNVPDTWKVVWTCNPSSSFGGQYNVIVEVYDNNASLVDGAVNTICKSGNTTDSTIEHQGGDIYLDISSEGDWTITVQALQ